MKILLMIVLLAEIISAQIPKSGNTNTVLNLAWQNNEWDMTDNGHLLIRYPDIFKAQNKLFVYAFMPSATDNRFIKMEKKIKIQRKIILGGVVGIAGYIFLRVLINSLK